MNTTPDCTQRSMVTLRGTTVELEYRLNAAEVQRRRAAGLVAVTQRHVLDVLTGLPVGMPVSPQCLSSDHGATLFRTPPGCVDFTPDGVVRLIIPALTAVAVVVRAAAGARGWRPALERAGRFAPYCARSVLVSAEPPTMELSVASFYGIGVVLHTASVTRTLLEPEPFTRRYCTSASWTFAEQAFAQVSQAAAPA